MFLIGLKMAIHVSHPQNGFWDLTPKWEADQSDLQKVQLCSETSYDRYDV